MSCFEREIDEDERCEAIDEWRRTRRMNSCWCGLDGYPGTCMGPQSCPYSGYHDKDEEGEDDAASE